MIEIIGIIASLFVLFSFLTKGELRIRLINSIGCIIFVIYGLCINSLSIWLLNGITLIINIYKSIEIIKGDDINVKY